LLYGGRYWLEIFLNQRNIPVALVVTSVIETFSKGSFYDRKNFLQQEFSTYVQSNSQMFYDVDSMLCRTPEKLEGKRLDKVTQAELFSVCSGEENPSYNKTALMKKSNNAWVGSNETILTES